MLKRFLAYGRPYRKYAFWAVFCIVTETVFELIIPLIMADMVDVGVANGDTAYIFRRGALMVGCALASMTLGVGASRFSAVLGHGLGAELRKTEYRKVQSFSFANTDHFQTSSLVTRLTNDVTTVQNAVATGLRPACRAPVMMTTALVVSFTLNAQLAVVFFVAAPILAVLLWQIIRHVQPMYGKMQGALDLVNRIVQENLTAIRVVKAYVRSNHEIDKFSQVNGNLRSVSERAFRISTLNTPAQQLVMYGTILCLLWFGGGLINAGNMKVGELTGFLSYVLQVLNSLMMLSGVFMMLTRALASGGRILEVMEEEVDIREDRAKDIAVERGGIEFDHVFFKYKKDAEEYVLSDVSLSIKAGETVAVIGQTGAAKTTLVQLIPRLYDATEGTVLVDGHPVWEYPLRHLRDAIAVVLQKNTLFSGTIRENLKWGREDATDGELEEACRIACADEFIGRLANGYDTELGQGGVNVSGGQKQRLCLARAILKKPKVLILDDSTSAVDTATEKKIREGLAGALPGTTKIIIAQRISSIMHADQIIILEDGRVEAVGDHDTLLRTSEIYRELYHSQQEGGML